MSWDKRRAVFEKSYDEVLLALKHQDDKLNRTLTAIAFLTAAGVAIFGRVAMGDEPVRFEGSGLDGSGLDATVVFFVTFLVSVLLALLIALSAIGPSDVLPRKTERPLSGTWPSVLFWAKIVKQPDWERRINEDPSKLDEWIARNLHDEAKTLAKRVNYKVGRSRESGAFVQVAVLSLVLLGIFSIDGIGVGARWWIASAVLIAVLAQPLWDLRQMKTYEFPGAEAAAGRYMMVGIAGVLASLLLLSAERFDIHWWAAFYAIGAILATRLAYVHRSIANLLLPLEVIAGPVVAVLALII